MGLLPTDPRLVCLDSDTGLFNGVDFGSARDRYLNLGVAEQNLLGTAAGLARSGRIPVVNTMATFATTRALEQVKVDIAFGNLPVRIVGTHGGFSAGHLGPTHHALEDISIMRAMPNMTVVVPADAAHTEQLFVQSLNFPGPVYLRLGRDATPSLPIDGLPVELGKLQLLSPAGGWVTIVACGPGPVLAALTAADELTRRGVSTTVLNLHTVKPLDVAGLLSASAASYLVITVEEHWASGGMGSAVAETLSSLAPVRVTRIAADDQFYPYAGDHGQLLERAGITAAAVVDAAMEGVADD